MSRCVILANYWAAHYKILLFNNLFDQFKDFKVVYLADTENIREWDIKKDELKFPCEIMFRGTLDDVNLLKIIVKTWSRLTTLNPEVLIIGEYSYIADWVGFFWAKFNKRKIILWSSSNEDDHKRFVIKELIKRFLVRNCDAANVYGTRSREYLLKLGAKKDRTFITGNNTANDYYFHETAKLKKDKPALCRQMHVPLHNFLYIGRFAPEKNLLFLLKCFRDIQQLQKSDDWGLILVGDGPQKKEIQAFIKNDSINNVFTPGFKQKQDIPQYLVVSDVFILPSISEPWGLVVNESMAAGLPVFVSKRCGCYPDLIKEGINGFSFDPFDSEELHLLMKNTIEGKYDLKAMSEASIDIIKNYTPKRAAKVVMETIELIYRQR